jgi:aflatoxin B1 aldehyde reductase
MSSPNGIKIIFGAGGYGTYLESLGVDGHALAREQLAVLLEEGVTTIDTAELYEGSEAELAYQEAPKRFTIHSKVKGGFAPGRDKDAIVEAGEGCLGRLGTTQVSFIFSG